MKHGGWLFLGYALAAWSQQPTSPWDELLPALHAAPSVRQAWAQHQAAQAEVEHTRAALRPTIQWEQTWFPWDNAAPHDTRLTHQLTLSGVLWYPGTVQRIAGARHAVRASHAEWQASQHNWLQSAVLQHTQHWVAETTLRVQHQWVRELAQHQRDVQAAFESHMASQLDVLEAQAQYDMARAELTQQLATRDVLAAQLTHLLGHPATTLLNLEHIPAPLPAAQQPVHVLWQQVMQRHPQLQAARARAAQLKHVMQAHATWLQPYVQWHVSHGRAPLFAATQNLATTRAARQTRWGLWITWPTGSPSAAWQSRQARLHWHAAVQDAQAAQQALHQQLLSLVSQIPKDRQLLVAHTQALQAAHARVAAVRAAVQAQLRHHAHLLAALTQQHQAQLTLLTQHAHVLDNQARMLWLVGTPCDEAIGTLQRLVTHPPAENPDV